MFKTFSKILQHCYLHNDHHQYIDSKFGVSEVYNKSSAVPNAVGSVSMTSKVLEINNNVSSVSYKFGTRTK